MEDVNVKYAQVSGDVHAVRGVSLSVMPKETVAIVGESGSGKSTTGLAAMGLIEPPGYVTGGEIWWKGAPASSGKSKMLSRIRGREIAMIFQEPGVALKPRLTIGRQMTEGMRYHLGMSGGAAKARACELLDLVGIQEPKKRLGEYPHQYSGGMLQRVAIAMALTCQPDLIIADEPTTALDVTVQARVLALLDEVKREFGLAVVLITHDLGVVNDYAQAVAIMYAGKIVESGPVSEIFEHPLHPYTQGLLASTPGMAGRSDRLTAIPGAPPDMSAQIQGCSFADRCAHATSVCRETTPSLDLVKTYRHVACWNWQTEKGR
jgi:oligopeptide/dipeptide ABC transporter ATP-binding protein